MPTSCGTRVADPVAGFGRGDADPDHKQAIRCRSRRSGTGAVLWFGYPVAGGEVDQGRVQVRVGGVAEVVETFGSGEACFVDPAGVAAFGAVVALGVQQFGQEAWRVCCSRAAVASVLAATARMVALTRGG